MQIMYRSTRDSQLRATASQAVLQGLAPDGGLYVPETIPSFDGSWEELSKMSYRETARRVMRLLLTDYTEDELQSCIDRAYDDKFDTEKIAPLREANGTEYLELFHGATIAFKDMALSILPHLMTTAAKKNRITDEIVILTATSGDTGKAAMAGFADVPGTKIIVFYPKDGVSVVQERQMVTQRGANVHVVGIHGNFDDAQTGVKNIFRDPDMNRKLKEHGMRFSSANSINIGRLVPQIVYYFYAYGQLVAEGRVKPGDVMNITVPTGNFGNILAAYYAKQMGLPVAKLICASNENKVLVDFFRTGAYDRNRDFILTSSPSMDILISSNLERLIYRIAGEDSSVTARLMKELSSEGVYCITEQNTHTAVASKVCRKYREETGDPVPMVVASTASPYKFLRAVITAIDPAKAEGSDFDLIDVLRDISGVKIPLAIEDIRTAPVLHDCQVDPQDMEKEIGRWLGLD